MPVPWMQIVQLMPTILDVSRELLKRSRRLPAETPAVPSAARTGEVSSLEPRVAALEDNERRQAELVNTMADQLAQLTAAATTLHRQVKKLMVGQAAAILIALVAVLIALR